MLERTEVDLDIYRPQTVDNAAWIYMRKLDLTCDLSKGPSLKFYITRTGVVLVDIEVPDLVDPFIKLYGFQLQIVMNTINPEVRVYLKYHPELEVPEYLRDMDIVRDIYHNYVLPLMEVYPITKLAYLLSAHYQLSLN